MTIDANRNQIMKPPPARRHYLWSRQAAINKVMEIIPGLSLSIAVAVSADILQSLITPYFPVPAIVLALIIGISLYPVAGARVVQPGLMFSIKNLLRGAVALLGIRVALSDVAALGVITGGIIILTMALTVFGGIVLAKINNQRHQFGILAGVATAVCGASATLATASVLPDYRGKQADVAFVIVGVNVISTMAMITYPIICTYLNFDARLTGVMLGATIHDVAQVVGAGYAVSDDVGNTAAIVKLFRVLLLVPVMMIVAVLVRRKQDGEFRIFTSAPLFAVSFFVLCIISSAVQYVPAALPIFLKIKAVFEVISFWGLLIAIAALGLGTSLSSILTLGWRPVLTLLGTTVVILLGVVGALLVF